MIVIYGQTGVSTAGERERQREHERPGQSEWEGVPRQRWKWDPEARLRKQLALLKDVITRDILLTKNLHSLCEYLRFNLTDRSHSSLSVLAMLLFALFLELLGWLILVGLFTTFCEYILFNAFDGNSWSPLSDLLITYHSPCLHVGQEF